MAFTPRGRGGGNRGGDRGGFRGGRGGGRGGSRGPTCKGHNFTETHTNTTQGGLATVVVEAVREVVEEPLEVVLEVDGEHRGAVEVEARREA